MLDKQPYLESYQALNKIMITSIHPMSPQVSRVVSESEIKAKLSEIKRLPTPVISWEVRYGFDHLNDPSLFINLMVEDADLKIKETDIEGQKPRFNKRLQARSIIQKSIRKLISDQVSIYVDFCMPSDFTGVNK